MLNRPKVQAEKGGDGFGMADFEDAVQVTAAAKPNTTYAIARTLEGFKSGPVPVITAQTSSPYPALLRSYENRSYRLDVL